LFPPIKPVMKKICSLILTLFVFSALSAQDAAAFFADARQAERDQNWSKAESNYTKAIKAAPDNLDYYLARGEFYISMSKDDKALADANKALQLDNSNPKAHLLKARYFVYADMPDSVMISVQNGLALNPEGIILAKFQIAKADAYRLLKDYDKAYDNYYLGLNRDTANIEALENIALVLFEQKDNKQAVYYLEKLIQTNPYLMDTYINVGYIYTRIGMFEESLSYLDQALSFDPHQPIALANKAFAQYKLTMYTEALSTINKSLQNYPTNPFACKVKGLILVATDNQSKACKEFQKAKKFGYNDLYDDGEVDKQIDSTCK
jgi:tetratricopeptide (TPR) repeat protein